MAAIRIKVAREVAMSDSTLHYNSYVWDGADVDYMRYAFRNCFRTKEEITEEVMGKIVNEIKSKYENE